MNFQNPGFAMTLRFSGTNTGPSRLSYSSDRDRIGHSPFAFPLFGRMGIAARTDYNVNGERDAFVFVTASKTNGREGRPICSRTTGGGLTWEFVAWIGREIVLRGDAPTWEAGYVRSAERPDGKVVTVYYFPRRGSGAIIAATIWEPR